MISAANRASDTIPCLARNAAIGPAKPSKIKNAHKNGMVKTMNGIRRPIGLRCRSLKKLTTGHTVAFNNPGIPVTMSAITQLGASRCLSFKGNTAGNTDSMSVKQKSPHNSHPIKNAKPGSV